MNSNYKDFEDEIEEYLDLGETVYLTDDADNIISKVVFRDGVYYEEKCE